MIRQSRGPTVNDVGDAVRLAERMDVMPGHKMNWKKCNLVGVGMKFKRKFLKKEGGVYCDVGVSNSSTGTKSKIWIIRL